MQANNHIEALHNKLKKVLRKAHMNVFELVEVFQREQGVMEVIISQLGGHVNDPAVCRKKRGRSKKGSNMHFTNNVITLEEYVRAISTYVGL